MEYYHYNYFRLRLMVYAAVVVLLAGVVIWRIQVEQGRSRDIQRVADALIIQSAFGEMFQHDRSYAAAADKGCDEVGQSIRRCRLRDYYKDMNQLMDPGKYEYVVSKVPDSTSFEVTFTLEHDHKNIKKGEHTITAEGIQ